MFFRTYRSYQTACSHSRLSGRWFSGRRRGVESLECRRALSTVSGVSAADAGVGGQGVAEEQSAMVADALSTSSTAGDGHIASTPCPTGETSLIDWGQKLVEKETPAEKLARLQEQLEGLEGRLKDLDKQWKKLSREYDDIHDKLAEKDPRPSSDEVARLEERLKEIGAEGDKIKAEQKEIEDEMEKLKAEIDELEKELAQDQDGGASSDNASAQDAADLAPLISGELLDLCLPPSEWEALAAAYWGDGGTGHLDMFTWPSGEGVLAAELASYLSNLNNDTGAIDFVRWGAIDVPSNTDDIGNLDLDDFESRRWLFLSDLP